MEFVKVYGSKFKLRNNLLINVPQFHITKKPINYKLFNEFLEHQDKAKKKPKRSFLIRKDISYERANHQQAIEFCQWFSERTGLTDLEYRIPTEAQLFSANRIKKLGYNDMDEFYHQTSQYKEIVSDYYHPDLKEYDNNTENSLTNQQIQNQNIKQVLKNISQKDEENLDNIVFEPLTREYNLNEKHNIPQLLQKAQYLERYLPKNANYQGLLKRVRDLLIDVEQEAFENTKLSTKSLKSLIELLSLVSKKCRSKLQNKSALHKLDKELKEKIIDQVKEAIDQDKKYTQSINKQFNQLQEEFYKHWPQDDKKALIPTEPTLNRIKKEILKKPNYSLAQTHHRTKPNKHFPDSKTIISFKKEFIRVSSQRIDERHPGCFFRLVISPRQTKKKG